MTWRKAALVYALALAALLFITYIVPAEAARTSAPDLSTSQGVASVWEAIRSLERLLLNHRHDGTDGSSDLVERSPNGACWTCGPDNAGAWACASTTCP